LLQPEARQQPHPPIIIGGTSARAAARLVRQLWYGFGQTVEQAAGIVRELSVAPSQPRPRPFDVSLDLQPLTPELMAQATAAGIDRMIYMPMVPRNVS
jgi:hypothetical protein